MKLLPFTLLALFALGACEEIIFEKLPGDTVYIERPGPVQLVPTFIAVDSTKECESTDTTDISIVIQDIIKNGQFSKDTLIKVSTACHALIKISGYVLVPKDSVLIPGDSIPYPVPGPIQYDTVWQIKYDRTVVYMDSIYIPGYTRPTWDVPMDLMPHLEEFYELARQYGKDPLDGMLIIHYTNDLPGENWVSSSFKMGENDQWVIFLDERYPAALHRASMLRELGRLALNKKYTQVPDRILNPTFSPEATITQKHLNELFN